MATVCDANALLAKGILEYQRYIFPGCGTWPGDYMACAVHVYPHHPNRRRFSRDDDILGAVPDTNGLCLVQTLHG